MKEIYIIVLVLITASFSSSAQSITGLVHEDVNYGGGDGGAGGGVACFLRAETTSADRILEIIGAANRLQAADLLITEEGRVDAQTLNGKLLARLLALAAQHRVPMVLVCGTLHDAVLAHPNVRFATSILTESLSLAEALRRTPELLKIQGELLGRLLATGMARKE